MCILLMLCCAQGKAGASSPVGRWQTISDSSGKPAAVVEIFESAGRFHGRIIQLLEDDPASVCIPCTDARKGQPIVGMVFLTGLRADGDEFTGGDILDPDDGRVYRTKVQLIEGGDKLKVRGFLGLSLFGRTQIWLRSP